MKSVTVNWPLIAFLVQGIVLFGMVADMLLMFLIPRQVFKRICKLTDLNFFYDDMNKQAYQLFIQERKTWSVKCLVGLLIFILYNIFIYTPKF